jgi:hypothetical protein
MKQLAAVMEVRMPEPCGPVVRTSHRLPAHARMPRLNSRRPAFLLSGSTAVAWKGCANSSRRPASFHSAGRTKR